MMKRNTGDLPDAASFALRNFHGSSHAVQIMSKPEQHQEVELNYLIGGSMTYMLHGELHELLPHRFYIFWAAVPHQVIYCDKNTKICWFTLPLTWVLQARLPGAFIEHLIEGRIIKDFRPSSRDAVACTEWLQDIRSGLPVRRDIAFEEISSRIRRVSLSFKSMKGKKKAHSEEGCTKSSAQYVENIVRIIALRYQSPLSIADIAAELKLHPNYMMTIFRKSCGISIQDYIIWHRLFNAQRLLSTSNEKIINIALESGFNSLSNFYAAFQRKFGMSPLKYRRTFRLKR